MRPPYYWRACAIEALFAQQKWEKCVFERELREIFLFFEFGGLREK